jgi:hypothetical protein
VSKAKPPKPTPTDYQRARSERLYEQNAAWLKKRGWRLSPEGWRHSRLAFPWPLSDAVKLTCEAEDGRADPVCMAMREEVWPA